MSDHFTEQLEEIEVLSSIFPTELEVLSNDPSLPQEFALHLQADSSNSANNHEYLDIVSASLIVKFPSEYPNIYPILSIIPKKGLSKVQVDELLALAIRLAEENIGMPCIFTIAEGIKEWLQDNNVPGQDGSMYADMIRRMQQKEVETKKKVEKAAILAAADAEQLMGSDKLAIDKEEEERIRRRQAGTAVTIETFMAWKATFDEEQRLLHLQSGKDAVKDERPTGKQLFLSKQAKNEDGGVSGEGENIGDLDFGDLADYEGLIENDDDDDEDYNPDEDDEEEDDDDDEEDENEEES